MREIRYPIQLVLAVCVAACGAVPAPDPGIDAPPDPQTTVLVSPSGDDANDGLVQPVKTLKRGIEIAASNPEIKTIALAAGRYDATSGEVFPYTVPENVTIAGPAGGGAILSAMGSTSAVPGLIVGAGKLADLEFERFTYAVTSNGIGELVNLRVRSSGTALRGETGSKLTVTNLDVTGTVGACATGVELNGDADLTVSEPVMRTLGVAFKVKDRTTVAISKASITGLPSCNLTMFYVSTTGTFALSESIVEGGGGGIYFYNTPTPTIATLTNTIVRNMKNNAISGSTVTFTMTGGQLANNGRAGAEADGGTWTFNNVEIKQNALAGISLFSLGAANPGTLSMHGCTLTFNGSGVYMFDHIVADFGTAANPGNNVFRSNTYYGLNIDGNAGARLITAVGNTWIPNVQLADADGKYPTAGDVLGPVEPGAGKNFAINAGWTLRR